MKHLSVFCVVAAMAFCLSPSSRAQPNTEANKLAVAGSNAAKDKDWDTAIENLRKAADLDHKYASNLAAALQQRATDATKQNRFPEAITDFNDAIKLNGRSASAYEGRAYVYMKMNDLDKALADYSEAIKLNPGEARYYSYRGYIYETKGDLKNAMADTEKLLKMQKNNEEAKARKTRLETRMKNQNSAPPNAPPPPAPAPTKGR
jgi:tetratricopeptide (TPR) repeat protein